MIHAMLKHGTAAEHEELERKLDFLLGPIERDRYEALLGRLYGFHAPVEASLAAISGGGLPADLADRRRAHLLADDLRHLGWDDGAIARLPAAGDLPPLRSTAEALGCLYVLEGSTLGGRIIGDHLARSLGLRPGSGASYFRGRGDATVPMWVGFLRHLEGWGAGRGDGAEIVASARRTFQCLDRWLTEGDEDRCATTMQRPQAATC